ncbi:ATP-dependent RNA helicase-like protein DB10 [Gossypium hirsutum]|uniref:RNA helicase n=1 Tax=Gossypium hirsutum TaxID=3635 RepID=A0A1U8N353_GOSHI|nr:ATP-dependent RNA helicase-like protein DB10 [Gossypium hirsutum]
MEVEQVDADVIALARGPHKMISTYDRLIINGFRVHTKKLEQHQKMKASTSVKHIVLPCSKSARSQLIPDIIHCYSSSGRTIIFIETKDSASELAGLLPGSRALHGDIQQAQREVTLNGFRLDKFMTLVATNVAVRGLDINDVQLIIQEKFDLQGKVEDSDILSHVGKLRKEFKSTLKTRYYKEMVQGGRSIEEIYENNPHGVHDDQWKWLVDDEEYCKLRHNQESRTKVGYAHTSGSTGYATLNTQFAEKEGREPSRLEQFRF